MALMQDITGDQRAEQLKSLHNKLILMGGLLVTVLGLCGVLGNILNNNVLMSFTPPTDPSVMALPTAIAIVFLGIGMMTILDSQPYKRFPSWLWPLRYISILLPASLGLWYLAKYLLSLNFDWLDISTHGLFPMSFQGSILITLSAMSLFIFLTKQQNERALVYGIGIPAFIIFNIGAMGVIGHLYDIPFLYAFRLALPTALAGLLIGLSLMVAPVSHKGIWLPVLSSFHRVRMMAILSGVFGFAVFLFGISTMAFSLHLNGIEYGKTLSLDMRHLLTSSIYACSIVGIAIKLVGLRASRYYSQSLEYAEQQVQATKALQQSHERFDVVANSLKNYAIFILDASGNITSWGQGPERVFHYRTDEVLGKHFSLFFPDDEKEQAHRELSLIREEGHAETEGWRLKKEDIRFWATVNSTALRDEQGNLLGFIKVVRDMTERKHLEEALKESEENFRTLADQAPIQVFMADATAHVSYYNKFWIEFTGLTLGELLGMGWEAVVHPDDLELLLKAYLKSAQARENYSLEARVKRWDGKYRYFLFTGGPRYLPNGEFGGYVGTGLDITERKEFEAALQQSEARFRRVVDANIIGVIFWTLDGQITDANDAFLSILGYSRADLEAGELNWRKLTPHEYAGVDDGFINDLRLKDRMEPFEKQYIAKDGHPVDILIVGAFMEGSEQHGVAFVMDISKRKQAEAALKESQRQLTESNRDLEQFAAVASHDLQAPLRKVQTFCDMIYANAKDRLDPDTLDLMERSKRSLASMQTLISDLLSLSRTAKEHRPLQQVEVSKVVYRVLMNLDDQIQQKRARITIESSATVLADEVQLEQLLQNLIGNGLKYQPPGQEPIIQIQAECSKDENMCQITVQDNGIGIPPEYQQRIFEPFERLHGKASPYEGTGVGLAICKRIIERHGGLIWVDSIPSKGSRFVIKLPTSVRANGIQKPNASFPHA